MRPRLRPARPSSVFPALALSALGLLGASGCGGAESAESDATVAVVAAFYPLEEAARAVGGDLVSVTGLTPPGQGPHDLELGARQVEAIEDADLVVYVGRGFQPQIEEAVGASTRLRALDVLDEVELLSVDPQLEGTQGEVDGEVLAGEVDPHVWLDPQRMISIVDAVTAALSEIDPDHTETYRNNADRYLAGLSGLDEEYRQGLASCRSRVIVTSHRAFGYLADSYGLRQIPIAGLSPEVEPDARSLEAIAAEAEAEGVSTIFLESIAPPELAETVAAEIGAELDLLDPIEGIDGEAADRDDNYARIMRENLARLRNGLGCPS